MTPADVEQIRSLGDNTGCMALKGASAEHEGQPRPDRWALDTQLEHVASRWGIDPQRDLSQRAVAARPDEPRADGRLWLRRGQV